ncbi:L-ascorbate oxidase-like isoform X2 [Mizuhopecten yessoensis]|nr:L-ascorbate oxidase-like isoform X2 [Mizuhopecten yessoensis]
MIYTINGQYPGPSIVVYQGQQVEVVVKNKLMSEGVTIHWHGLIQWGTPWMDGVGSLSHCPINPEQTFTYSFLAEPSGTHWYHSHHGAQRTEGLTGALVVLERTGEEEKEEANQNKKTEFLMFLQDWFHESSTELISFLDWGMLQFLRGFDADQCFVPYAGANQENVGFLPFESILINGKGNSFLTNMTADSVQWTVETFNVTANDTYRFRVISATMVYPLQVSVDQHELEVVAVDGNAIVGVRGDAVIINGGERFDMLVRTDQPIGSYWIRVSTLANGGQNQTLGILRYEGSNSLVPDTERTRCDVTRPCIVVNCLFGQYPDDLYTHCVSIGDMKSTPEVIQKHPVSLESADAFQEIFLNFHYTRGSPDPFPTSINGKRFIRPSVPLQLLPSGNDTHVRCADAECQDICDCTNIVKLAINDTIQLVLLNMDNSRNGLAHGIHIHGHHVHVIKVGYPKYNTDSTGRITEQNADILCDTPICNHATWLNPSWAGDGLPEANMEDPPLKDTILVPRQGYVVVRFKADNPGFWFMHCHMEPHAITGMALILQEGETGQMPTPPSGLQGCGNFFSLGASTNLLKGNSLLNTLSSDQIPASDSMPCGHWDHFKVKEPSYIAVICILCVLNITSLAVLYVKVKYTDKISNIEAVKLNRRIEINERTEPETFGNHVYMNKYDKHSYTSI